MKIEQRYWTESDGWQTEGGGNLNGGDAQWVLFPLALRNGDGGYSSG